MSWIEQIPVAEATGPLKAEFDRAIERAGGVANIIHVMSQNPSVMQASMGHYEALMHRASPLSRQQREMLATVVSAELGCPY